MRAGGRYAAQVDFRYGTIFGLFTSSIAITFSIVLSGWVEQNSDALEKAAAFVPLIIGLQFGARAFVAYRKRRQRQAADAERAANGAAIAPITPLDDGEGCAAHARRRNRGRRSKGAHARCWPRPAGL